MAKKKRYLVSTKAKGLKFEVVKLDRESMKATLKGETGVAFDMQISQDVLEKYGYTVEIVEVEDAEAVSA